MPLRGLVWRCRLVGGQLCTSLHPEDLEDSWLLQLFRHWGSSNSISPTALCHTLQSAFNPIWTHVPLRCLYKSAELRVHVGWIEHLRRQCPLDIQLFILQLVPIHHGRQHKSKGRKPLYIHPQPYLARCICSLSWRIFITAHLSELVSCRKT